MSNTNTVANPMKVITGKDTRWSYANVWEAKSINGSEEKFSVSCLVSKSDKATIAKINNAIEAAKEEAKAEMEEIEEQSSDENYSSTSSYSSESTQNQSVDNSWMDGHWRFRTQYGVSNLYIDTKNKKIKMYTTLYSDGQPNLDYSGTYILYNDASSAYGNAYRGYKALSFGGTVIFADPDVCKLCDGPGEEYFEHVR